MSRRIPQTFIHDLLNQVNLVDLIEKRISLKKAGARFVAKCPFHQEKTASFSVDPHKQFYYCFGCHAHGNAIGFLMAYDRMEFVDAVESLAASLGIPVPSENGNHEPAAPQPHADLFPLMEKAALFYQRCLLKSPEALQYLKKRGISEKTRQTFGLGFAPNAWDHLAQKILQQPELLEKMKEAGMLCEKPTHPGHYYDRFRNRLLFPIQNSRGQVIGFGGRSIDEQMPKYLNSPETPLFHKGNELYGLNLIKKTKSILVVEGYMDVIALHQHGILHAVAPLGTAITRKQIQTLLRYAPEVIFCFDADSAGQKAAWRALETLLPIMKDSTHACFLTLPAGEDPDSFIRKKGAQAFENALQTAAPLSDFFFNTLSQPHNLNTIHGKTQFAKTAKQHLDTMPNGLFKQLMLDKLAQLIQVSPDQLSETLSPQQSMREKEKPFNSTLKRHKGLQVKPRANKAPSIMRITIALLLQYPHLIDHIPDIEMLKHLQLPGISLLQALIQIIQSYPNLTTGTLLEHFRDQPNEQKHLAKLASAPLFIPSEGVKTEFLDAIKRIQQQGIQQTINQLQAKLHDLSATEKEMLQKLIAYKVSGK